MLSKLSDALRGSPGATAGNGWPLEAPDDTMAGDDVVWLHRGAGGAGSFQER
jgi:hypothetical protein